MGSLVGVALIELKVSLNEYIYVYAPLKRELFMRNSHHAGVKHVRAFTDSLIYLESALKLGLYYANIIMENEVKNHIIR